MARNSLKQKALRTLASLLAIIVAMGVLVLAFSKTEGGQLTPKLGLDLEGGTELILQPVLDSGQVVSPSQIEQAVNIIRQRIDANGVAEAEISTLGGTSIDIAIPGKPSVEQLDAVAVALPRCPHHGPGRDIRAQPAHSGDDPHHRRLWGCVWRCQEHLHRDADSHAIGHSDHKAHPRGVGWYDPHSHGHRAVANDRGREDRDGH